MSNKESGKAPMKISCSMDNISSMESKKLSSGGALKREPRGNMSVVLVANVCQLGCIRCMRRLSFAVSMEQKGSCVAKSRNQCRIEESVIEEPE